MNFPLLSKIFKARLEDLPNRKLLINTINAHSFNVARKDSVFFNALQSADILLPDGVSVIMAARILLGVKIKKIAGADLFQYQLRRLNTIGGSCFFLGSSELTLQKIYNKAKIEFPNVKVNRYSPPYKTCFSDEDCQRMIESVNAVKPDVLFIGMTAPKQEKWAHTHFNELNAQYICCIGAVFDFYAGNIQRAPQWIIDIGLEWLYRLVKEPKRLARRYIIGNSKFVLFILKQKIKQLFELS